mgnify:CR=1 FL=1
MIDATFCNAVSLLTGFTGWVLAVWSFLRPERDRSGWKLAGGTELEFDPAQYPAVVKKCALVWMRYEG